MAQPEPLESKRLTAAREILNMATRNEPDATMARFALLESVSCEFSGISNDDYYSVTCYEHAHPLSPRYVELLQQSIVDSGIQTPLALASLARVDLDELETKRNGAVYTDFRLADYLADEVMRNYDGGAILDPSCGTSIILAACAIHADGLVDNQSSFVATCLYGVDLSPLAVRGSILSLAAMLKDSEQLKLLFSHFLVGDSLDLRNDIASHFGFNAFSWIVGNPPWEKVKPSRSEFARGRGINAAYGSEIDTLPDGYESYRVASHERASALAASYGLNGEIDLYRAFLVLSQELCANDGGVALYLPAGLIRSKTLSSARQNLLDSFSAIELDIFMNQARFFAIDTRFKFVLAVLNHKNVRVPADHVTLKYSAGNDEGVVVSSSLQLSCDLFCDSSGELGAPEVKTPVEASVLRTMWENGERMSSHPIFSGIKPVRELDMTLDRKLFSRTPDELKDPLPVIEGRMVSQYRCGCKIFLSGSGRSAKWAVVPPGCTTLKPQFFVDGCELGDTLQKRVGFARVGFCDIAGQTNERTMQAARIPARNVCGNKVPTLLFPSHDEASLWLGIANSFAFDWIVRRYITTTINFFILRNLPLALLDFEHKKTREIIGLVNEIQVMESRPNGWERGDFWDYACIRAGIDARVFEAYGIGPDEAEIIFEDFPLVDQANGKLAGGLQPTFDLIRFHMGGDYEYYEKARLAWSRGALPFVPNEHMRGYLRNSQ